MMLSTTVLAGTLQEQPSAAGHSLFRVGSLCFGRRGRSAGDQSKRRDCGDIGFHGITMLRELSNSATDLVQHRREVLGHHAIRPHHRMDDGVGKELTDAQLNPATTQSRRVGSIGRRRSSICHVSLL
jgi:hypothetical protein